MSIYNLKFALKDVGAILIKSKVQLGDLECYVLGGDDTHVAETLLKKYTSRCKDKW